MPEEKRAPQPVDLSDLSLSTEPLGDDFNPEADAFSMPPPPDDGVHRVSLGYGSARVQQGVAKTGKMYIMFHLQMNPVDEKGWAVFDRPSTMVFGSSGTSRVAGIIKAVTGQPAKSRDVVSLAKELDALIQGERTVKVETQWVASCNHGEDGGKYKVFKRGQTKFPKLGGATNGNVRYSPEIECPKCRAVVNAQAQVNKYLPDGMQAKAAQVEESIESNPFG